MGFIVLLIVTAGLLVLSRVLAPKRKQEDQVIETALSRRGEFLPFVIGRHKIENYFFAWAGDRINEPQSTGGKGGGGKGGKEDLWFESGWHVLTLGPATELTAIFENGEVLWDGPISPVTHPSGTSVTLDDGSTFEIFWGELDQPINSFLASPSRVDVASRWPFLCYVVWKKKKLGSAPVWPKLDYVLRVGCTGAKLKDTDFEMDVGSSKGVNGAHTLLRLLNERFPHGAGIPLSNIDNDSLEALGALCEDESLATNMRYRGESYTEIVQNLLQDLGVWMPQIASRLVFFPWRETDGDVPVLDDDVVVPPDIESVKTFSFGQPTRITFTYKSEEELKYEDQDIQFDDDSTARDEGVYDTETVNMESITHHIPASAIARRRAQESALHAAQRLVVLRGARNLQPGQVFDRPGEGRYLVISRKPNDDSPGVELNCVFEQYAFADIPDLFTPGPGSGGVLPAENDIAVDWFEIPNDPGRIIVLRTRKHQQITGSRIFVSAGESSFSYAGDQNPAAAGGLLEEPIGISEGPDIIGEGPTFETSNADVLNVLDLSGNPSAWQSGQQLAVINDEFFYLESVTVQPEDQWEADQPYSVGDFIIPSGAATGLRYRCITAGTSGAEQPAWPSTIGGVVNDGTAQWQARGFSYRMNNMIRARETSETADHGVGDRVFIIEKSRLSIISHPLITFGTNLCIKSVPFTSSQIVPIGDVTPVCKTILQGGSDTDDDLRITEDGDFRITQTGDFRTTE